MVDTDMEQKKRAQGGAGRRGGAARGGGCVKKHTTLTFIISNDSIGYNDYIM